MVDSSQFYAQIAGIQDFPGVCNPLRYHPAPEDWHVFVADIAGSTRAIEAGRYKDVNAVGVCCIVAALNACPDIEFPYVFGGDGATLLVPEQRTDAVRSALLGVANLAERVFGLTLRVGAVPMRSLLARGHRVGVARLSLSPDVSLAMLTGDGVQVADEWIKAPESLYVYAHSDAYEASLDGFECRWEPLRSTRGSMLSLIVLARDHSAYQRLIAFIDDLGAVQPASAENLQIASALSAFETEASLKTRHRNGFARWFHMLQTLIVTSIGRFLLRIKRNFGGFNGRGYIEQTALQSDFRKFDGVLRMVLDLDDGQRLALERYLAEAHRAGAVYYGTHTSDHGLLTCLVRDYMGSHVHFVDGGQGGYAMAARQLKSQLAERRLE
ncbi:MAG: DUF3095 domain-containing protein [Myxococcota bacterium]